LFVKQSSQAYAPAIKLTRPVIPASGWRSLFAIGAWHQKESIFVTSAMVRNQIQGARPQHTDEQRRNRVDTALPLEPFALADC
jgi:hypothetical protein